MRCQFFKLPIKFLCKVWVIMYQTDTDENYIDMTNFNVEFFMLNDFEIPLVLKELKGV